MLYHYCAKHTDSSGVTYMIDGLYVSEHPVINMQRYRDMKKSIAPEFDGVITITSLTILDSTITPVKFS